MHRFLYVQAKSPSAMGRLIDRLKADLLRQLPFRPETVTVRMLGNKDIFVSAVASTQWEIDYADYTDHDVTLVDGLAFLDQENLTAAAVRQLFSVGPEHLFERLQGQYCVVHASPNRIKATVDCTGSRPLYFIETSDWLAISNRQSLLSPICTESGYRSIDLKAAAWTLTHLHLFGQDSVYSGVKLLLPGTALIAENGDLRIQSLKNSIWHKGATRPIVTEHEFDDATSDLLNSFKAISNFSQGIEGKSHLSITGGKDSRLGLALAQSTGLSGELELFTYGQPQSPECQVARHLCELQGLKHTSLAGDPRSDLNIDDIWKRLRYAAFRFDLSHGGVDGGYLPTTQKTTDLDLTGSFADIFRRVWKHSRDKRYATVSEAAREWTHGWPTTFDGLNVVKAEIKENQRRSVKEWMASKISDGVDLNDMQEIYYVNNRMTWWAGSINSAQLSRYRIMPLASLKSARTGMRLDVSERSREKLHFEVLKRLSPSLLAAPFLNDTWDQQIRLSNPSLNLADKPFELGDVPPSETAPPWFAWFIQMDMKTIKSYLLDSPFTGLFEIAGYEAVERALSRPDAHHAVQARQILNMLMIQMALTRDLGEPRDDIRRLSETSLFTNLPEFVLEEPAAAHRQRSPNVGAKLLKVRLPGGVKSVRIDPSNKPGLVRIRNLILTDKGNVTNFSLLNGAANADVQIIQLSEGQTIFQSIGFDPSLIYDISTDRALDLELEIFCESGDYAEIFWSKGEPYSASSSKRIFL